MTDYLRAAANSNLAYRHSVMESDFFLFHKDSATEIYRVQRGITYDLWF